MKWSKEEEVEEMEDPWSKEEEVEEMDVPVPDRKRKFFKSLLRSDF